MAKQNAPIIASKVPVPASISDLSLFYRMFESFPFPVQVLSLDGIAIWLNRAMQDVFAIEPEKHIGHYQVFSDPFVLENQWEASIRQAMRGETTFISDVQIDHRTYARIVGRHGLEAVALTHDISCFPILDDHGRPMCIASMFLIRKRYQGREEVVRAKQYMDCHWRDPFRIEALSELINLSPSHFHRLFRAQEGVTPHGYHSRLQVEKIKEQLMNPDMTISEAFAACGIDYHGHYARMFRNETGMTPSEYRERLSAHQKAPEKQNSV